MQNWISLGGMMIAGISFLMIIFLFIISTFLGAGGLYLGLLIYIVLPAVMIAGLILVLAGMIIWRWRQRKHITVEQAALPKIDLNDAKHRRAFIIFSTVTTLFLFISAIGSYEAFHYTESVEFCGKLCHYLMIPEYTAYQYSPHAKVACVSCHVGPGANWYVRSKLAGLYQVYATLTKTYPKPIPTPIKNLRPAREVCEQCHWPQKFYPYKLRLETHYLTDTPRSPWQIRLIMKIGAEHQAQGLKAGIHWHINPDVKIEYAALDQRGESIAWVRSTDLKSGKTTVFEDPNNPLTPSRLDSLGIKTMDCIDCHNRPSHDYRSPALFVNTALAAGDIPDNLPEFKSLAMEICADEYPTTDSVRQAIRQRIYDFYQQRYPEIAKQTQLLDQGVAGLSTIVMQNIFPEMKVRWNVHPNHIGHLEFKGCFRCHDDSHVATNGAVIRRDCTLCHSIVEQGIAGKSEVAVIGQSLEFKHPVDIEETWRETLCSDCHSGLNP